MIRRAAIRRYPQHAVSVLMPVGAALIGLSVGQSIDWEMSGARLSKLTVLDVGRRPADGRTREASGL